MGFFCVGNSPRRWSEIGVGAGDMEIAQEVREAQGDLVEQAPPPAEAVYVCGWCFRVVLRSELNHADTVSGCCVCDDCVNAKNSSND